MFGKSFLVPHRDSRGNTRAKFRSPKHQLTGRLFRGRWSVAGQSTPHRSNSVRPRVDSHRGDRVLGRGGPARSLGFRCCAGRISRGVLVIGPRSRAPRWWSSLGDLPRGHRGIGAVLRSIPGVRGLSTRAVGRRARQRSDRSRGSLSYGNGRRGGLAHLLCVSSSGREFGHGRNTLRLSHLADLLPGRVGARISGRETHRSLRSRVRIARAKLKGGSCFAGS